MNFFVAALFFYAEDTEIKEFNSQDSRPPAKLIIIRTLF